MNAPKRTAEDLLTKSHRDRSNFVRQLVQGTDDTLRASTTHSAAPPKRVVHFWDDLDRLPGDVNECMETWLRLEQRGFERLLYDSSRAREFISRRLGERYRGAFDECYHPAMQSDYFRLCYLFTEGGSYVDSDDVYLGAGFDCLFEDGRLKVQPLCYDMSTDEMVPPAVFSRPGADSLSWIFYFNNNPLVAANGHPLVERALENATISLEQCPIGRLPDIQSTTGPGNLSKAVFDFACDTGSVSGELLILRDWEGIAATKWPLSYRNDGRNWRLSSHRADWRPD